MEAVLFIDIARLFFYSTLKFLITRYLRIGSDS